MVDFDVTASLEQLIQTKLLAYALLAIQSEDFRNQLKDVILDSIHSKPPDSEKIFLTQEEAANYIRCAKATLYSYTSKGEISYYKTPGGNLFEREELDAWIKKHRILSNEELKNQADAYLAKKAHRKDSSS